MKISINLLPPEITAVQLKRAKFYKIQAIGVAIVLITVFLTSLTLALRILQSRNIVLYQAKLASAQQRVLDLKDTQASLFLLKNRLATINQYLGVSSQQSSMYRLLDKLIPASVVINAVTVNKSGEAVLLALAPDAVSLDALMSNLTLQENNNSALSQVSVESLNRGRDGIYRISLKIKPN